MKIINETKKNEFYEINVDDKTGEIISCTNNNPENCYLCTGYDNCPFAKHELNPLQSAIIVSAITILVMIALIFFL